MGTPKITICAEVGRIVIHNVMTKADPLISKFLTVHASCM